MMADNDIFRVPNLARAPP